LFDSGPPEVGVSRGARWKVACCWICRSGCDADDALGVADLYREDPSEELIYYLLECSGCGHQEVQFARPRLETAT
jgi:hypothetical protein